MRTQISAIGKIAAIERLLEGTGYTNSPVTHFNGGGEHLWSHKVMLEGVDFDLVYTPLKHLGYKAVLNVVGEVYAALYRPEALSLRLGISSRFCFEDVEELVAGAVAALKEHGIERFTLDLVPSLNGLCISLACGGAQEKGFSGERTKYKNMDLICLSGRLGSAYMGMHVLQREKVSFTGNGRQPDLTRYSNVIASYLSPEVKPNTVSRFVDTGICPSGGFFVTQGLADALLRLTRESGFGTKVYLDRIPFSDKALEVARELDIDPATAAMNGGDDYQFIFTVPIEKSDVARRDFQDYEIIGHLARPEVGAVLVTPDGAKIPVRAQAFSRQESIEM